LRRVSPRAAGVKGAALTREVRVIADVAESIKDARRRVAQWPLKSNDFSALQGGLKDTYRSARKSLAAAYAERTAENFHQWCKQVGYLRDMVRILEPIRPNELEELAARLKRLETYLGNHHDLVILRQWFLVVAEQSNEAHKAGPFLALISDCQAKLQAQARPAG
jgi:CHAD domain-containing protein